MREIKFRAWWSSAQKMYEVSALEFNKQQGITSIELIDSDGQHHLTEDAQLMQFTGLKDKNGREIYEGDIVKGDLRRMYLMPYESNPQILAVDYEDDMRLNPFHVQVGYDGELWVDVLEDGFEVIGNIYENKDLLK